MGPTARKELLRVPLPLKRPLSLGPNIMHILATVMVNHLRNDDNRQPHLMWLVWAHQNQNQLDVPARRRRKLGRQRKPTCLIQAHWLLAHITLGSWLLTRTGLIDSGCPCQRPSSMVAIICCSRGTKRLEPCPETKKPSPKWDKLFKGMQKFLCDGKNSSCGHKVVWCVFMRFLCVSVLLVFCCVLHWQFVWNRVCQVNYVSLCVICILRFMSWHIFVCMSACVCMSRDSNVMAVHVCRDVHHVSKHVLTRWGLTLLWYCSRLQGCLVTCMKHLCTCVSTIHVLTQGCMWLSLCLFVCVCVSLCMLISMFVCMFMWM